MAVSFQCDMPRQRRAVPVKKYLEVEITSPLPDAVRITKLSIGYTDDSKKRLKKGCTSLMYCCQQGLTADVIEKVHSEVKQNLVAFKFSSIVGVVTGLAFVAVCILLLLFCV
jgi:hypothetical protein